MPSWRSAGGRCRRSIRTRRRSISRRRSSGPGEEAGSIGSLREPGIATWVSAHNYSPTELGVMSVSAELAPDRVDATLDGIAETVTRLALLGPRPGRSRARSDAHAGPLGTAHGVHGGRAASLAAAEAFDGYEFLDRGVRRARVGRPDQVRAVARDTCSRIRFLVFSTFRAKGWTSPLSSSQGHSR